MQKKHSKNLLWGIVFLVTMLMPQMAWADGETTWTLVGEKCGTCANNQNIVISFQTLNNTAWGDGSVAGHTQLSYPNCKGTQFSGSTPVADQKLISISQYEHSETVPAHTKLVRRCIFQTVMATARYRHGLGLYLFDDLASATTTNLDAMPDQNAKAFNNAIPEANLLLQQTDNDGFHSKEMVVRDVVYDNSASDTEKTITKYIVLVHVNTSGTTNLNVAGLEWAGFREMSDIDINFNPNGATGGEMNDQVITTSGTLNGCSYTYDGYTFTGWNTEADGSGKNYAVGTPFTYSEETKGLIKLYAQWTANKTVMHYTAASKVTPHAENNFKNANGGSLSITNNFNSETGEGEYVFNGILTEIGNNAFYGCQDLKGNITIPNSVKTIGNSAFFKCFNTSSLTLSNSVKTIGDNAFNSCNGLTGSLTIPNSVVSIGYGAFASCKSINGNLTIGSSVETIGQNAFRGCTGLKSVTFKSIPNVPNKVQLKNGNTEYAFHNVTSNINLVLDDNSYVASNKGDFPALATAPTYTREMSNEWETLVVPFAISYSKSNGNYKLYQIVGASGENVAIDEYADNASIPAGTSMLIKAIGNKNRYGKYEITLTAADKSVNTAITIPSAMNGLNLTGTYATKQVAADGGYVLSGSKFVKTTATTDVTRFRAYFDGSVAGVSELNMTDTYIAITFNANGGTGTMAQQAIVGSESLNANAFTRENYIFNGWNTKADGSGTSYADAAAITVTESNKGPLTLYAQWTPTATITFNNNGGTGNMAQQVIAGSGTLKANAFTRENYVFNGWNTKADGTGTEYAAGATFTATDSNNDPITLYAQWSLPVTTITLNANGGEGSMATLYIDNSGKLTANAFTRDGYQFVGWRTAADGGTYYIDESAITVTTTNVGTATLYAWWAPVGNTVWHYTATSQVNPKYPKTLQDAKGNMLSFTNGFNNETKDCVYVFNGTLVRIEQEAFRYCKGFTGDIVIPETVEYIGPNAFSSLNGSISNLILPSSVYNIGNYAFYGFPGAIKIKSIPYTGNNAFEFVKGAITLVLDDNSHVTPNNKGHFPSLKSASYSRDIKANWNTICLPFEAKSTDDVKFYVVESLSDGIIKLQLAETLAAGKPALVYSTSNTKLTVNASSTSVVTSAVNAEGTNRLVGTLTSTTVKGATDTDHYLFGLSANTGKYVKVSSDVALKPFRAYIECNKEGNPAAGLRQVISDEDINETAISDVVDTLNDSEAQYFDMNGRKLNGLQKGINIVKKGGKVTKIMIK